MTGRQVEEVTIGVPGNDWSLTMRAPEWVELASGWQLGGWVEHDQANVFGALYVTDRVILTRPGALPEFVSLRSDIPPPTSYGLGSVYLRIPAVRPPHGTGADS